MNAVILLALLVVGGSERPPQAPPVDPRFNTLLTPSEPLANVIETAEPASTKTYTFVGTSTSGEGVPVLADSQFCQSGNCPASSTRRTVQQTTTSQGACGSYESSSFEEVTTYSEKPKKGGLFRRLFGGKKCKGGRCG